MGSDEVRWKDVAVHGCKILNASGKYLFVTTSQLETNASAIGHARSDGFRIVTVPDNIHAEVAGALDLTGAPVRDLGIYQTERNKSFRFDWVPVERMTAQERAVFAYADAIAGLIGGVPKHVRAIRISQTMRPDFLSGTETLGVWDADSASIVIWRDQLKSLEAFAGTLLHELAHARSGHDDVTREFEDELTMLLGATAAAAVNTRSITPPHKRLFWRR
jgi:hypothetical protein